MQDQDYDERYVAFFECFNRQRYFEAHEVLERLWLPQRQGPNGRFYKGLIQLAAAFLHLQKCRTGPAQRLFVLADENLQIYPHQHEGLDVAAVRDLIRQHLLNLREGTFPQRDSRTGPAPQLHLKRRRYCGRGRRGEPDGGAEVAG
jgi:predicted metal-dependent hydrolase